MNDLLTPLRKQDKKTGLSEYMVTFLVIWFIWNRQNVLSIIIDDKEQQHQAVTDLFNHEWWVWLLMVAITFVVMAVRIFLIECGTTIVIFIERIGTKMQQNIAPENWIEKERFDKVKEDNEAKNNLIDLLRSKVNPLESELSEQKKFVSDLQNEKHNLNSQIGYNTNEHQKLQAVIQLMQTCLHYKDDTQTNAFITFLNNGRNDQAKLDFLRIGSARLNNQNIANYTGIRVLMSLEVNGQRLFEDDETLSRTGLLTLQQLLAQNIR